MCTERHNPNETEPPKTIVKMGKRVIKGPCREDVEEFGEERHTGTAVPTTTAFWEGSPG